jgi:methyl-accepting chemotaxis protein
MSIHARLVAIVVLFALGTGVLAAIASVQMKSRIMAERQTATRSVVETALGVVRYYGQQEQSGAMTKDEAQKAALAAVGQLRYSG